MGDRGGSAAIFLDRDGTLVESRPYPSRPEHLRLYEGIAAPLRLLQEVGYRLIVVTNQSGLARALFSEADLQRMHGYLCAELERQGVRLDAIYHCPHHPDGVVPDLAIACPCRKPQPGMLLHAAAEHDLDLTGSWVVGDALSDVEAGNRAGCRSLLVDLGTEAAPQTLLRQPYAVARTTVHALQIIAALDGALTPVEQSYRPARWGSTGATRQSGTTI